MASANVLTLTDANFESEVLKSDKPVLVDFWATWCQPCVMLGPTIDKLADDFAGKVKVGKVDTDANTKYAMQLSVQAIPAVFLFKGGQVIKRWGGLQRPDVYASALNEVLNA